jgi:hypothetical protein
MLLPLLLLLQQAANPRLECPALSGDYVIQGEDGRVYVDIVQTDCKRIAIVWNNASYANDGSPSRHRLVLDGQFHMDTGWFGSKEPVLISAAFRASRLEMIAKPTKSLDTTAYSWKHVFEHLANGDICARFLEPGGNSWSAWLAARRKTKGRAGENEAARRSEKGCS